jgi:hypothetical protein
MRTTRRNSALWVGAARVYARGEVPDHLLWEVIPRSLALCPRLVRREGIANFVHKIHDQTWNETFSSMTSLSSPTDAAHPQSAHQNAVSSNPKPSTCDRTGMDRHGSRLHDIGRGSLRARFLELARACGNRGLIRRGRFGTLLARCV